MCAAAFRRLVTVARSAFGLELETVPKKRRTLLEKTKSIPSAGVVHDNSRPARRPAEMLAFDRTIRSSTFHKKCIMRADRCQFNKEICHFGGETGKGKIAVSRLFPAVEARFPPGTREKCFFRCPFPAGIKRSGTGPQVPRSRQKTSSAPGTPLVPPVRVHNWHGQDGRAKNMPGCARTHTRSCPGVAVRRCRRTLDRRSCAVADDRSNYVSHRDRVHRIVPGNTLDSRPIGHDDVFTLTSNAKPGLLQGTNRIKVIYARQLGHG